MRLSGSSGFGLALTAALVLASGAVRAQTFLYALTEKGRLTINGQQLDKLPSNFDPDDFVDPHFEEAWSDLAIEGQTRHALRLDGRVFRNGKKVDMLPFEGGSGWLDLEVAADVVYALRADGLVTEDGEELEQFPVQGPVLEGIPAGSFPYRSLLFYGLTVLALRADGSVFVGVAPNVPIGRFVGGETDGQTFDTQWFTMKLSPDGELYGLRRDGVVSSLGPIALIIPDPSDGGPPGIPQGEEITRLPFSMFNDLNYDGFGFTDDGEWHALHRSGALYDSDHTDEPLVDFAGGEDLSEFSDLHRDLVCAGQDVFSIRFDGKVFRAPNPGPFLSNQKEGYTRLAFSSVPPDLSQFKNQKPVAALYDTRGVVGQPIILPVVANDVDLPADELDITVDEETMPPGSTWDPIGRELSWPAPVEGKSLVEVTVDDGVNKPGLFKYKIRVLPVDDDPEKNKKPQLTKIKKAQALVGHELRLPIYAFDRDGDPVVLSVDEASFPFDSGATFTPDEDGTGGGVFTWTPTLEHLGKAQAVFEASDGSGKVSKLKLKLKVVFPLLFGESEEPPDEP